VVNPRTKLLVSSVCTAGGNFGAPETPRDDPELACELVFDTGAGEAPIAGKGRTDNSGSGLVELYEVAVDVTL
jgi:hypothetical protein